jgi:hypothetical protein
MILEDTENHNIPGQLAERVTVSWSKPRSWHGDSVVIRVRTERVSDGYLVRLQVYDQAAVTLIEQLPNQPIANNKIDLNYTLNWKTRLAQPPPYPNRFLVRATIILLNITADSDPMDVDLIPPLFSA